MAVKKRANPEAHENNLLVAHTAELLCCNSKDLVVKRYHVTKYLDGAGDGLDFTTKVIDSIEVMIDGAVVSIPIPPYTPSVKNTRLALAAAFKSVGYDPYYHLDGMIGISVITNAVTFLSELPVVSITVGGVACPLVETDTSIRVYGFCIDDLFGNVSTVEHNGDGVLATLTWPADATDLDAFHADISTQLATLVNIQVETVRLYPSATGIKVVVYTTAKYLELYLTSAGSVDELDAYRTWL